MSDFCCRDIIECMVNAFSRSPNFTSKRMSDDAIELGVNRGYNRDEVEARYIKDMGEGPRESFSLEEAKKDIDELSSENIKNAYKLNYYEMIKEGNSNYYMISKKTPNEGDYASQNTGFKIHVSLAHKNEKDISGDNVDKAWDIALPLLIEHGVYQFKRLNNSGDNPGKEIVIYASSARKDLDWKDLLSTMHTKFEENEIIPGAEPCHRVGHKFTEEVETKIKSNSPYFYMENDSITDENNIKKTIERRQKLENDEDKNPLHRNKIEDIINRININSIR